MCVCLQKTAQGVNSAPAGLLRFVCRPSLRKYQPLCRVLCNKAWSLVLDIVAEPCCWSGLFRFRHLCLPGERKLILPLRRAFHIPLCGWGENRSNICIFPWHVFSCGCICFRPWRVTYRTSRSVTGHSRKQKCVCVFGVAGFVLLCGGLNPSKPGWFPHSRGGTKPCRLSVQCDNCSF